MKEFKKRLKGLLAIILAFTCLIAFGIDSYAFAVEISFGADNSSYIGTVIKLEGDLNSITSSSGGRFIVSGPDGLSVGEQDTDDLKLSPLGVTAGGITYYSTANLNSIPEGHTGLYIKNVENLPDVLYDESTEKNLQMKRITLDWFDQINFTIRMNLNGGTCDVELEDIDASTGETAWLAPLPAGIRKAGAEFIGWSFNSNATVSEATGEAGNEIYIPIDFAVNEGDVVDLYAVWRPITYELSYYYVNLGNNVSLGESETATIGDSGIQLWDEDKVTIPSEVNPGMHPTKWMVYAYNDTRSQIGEFTFGSRITASDLAQIEAAGFFPADEAHQLQLFASDFRSNTFVLSYDANGGTGPAMVDDVVAYNPDDYVQTIDLATESSFTRTGYTFKGWAETSDSDELITSVSVNQADFADKVNTKTVYAVWETVKYSALYTGETDTDTYTDTNVFISNNAGRYTARLATKDVVAGWSMPTGYHAVSWGDTTGATFDFGEDIPVAAYRLNDVAESGEDLFSLSLRYAPNTSTVKFNGNGGTCNIDDVSAEYDPDGTNAITIPTAADVATRTGYTFKGWSKTPNGNLDLVGSSLTLDFTEEETVTTLYAQWDPIPFTLAFNSNGGEGSMDAVAGKAGFRMELPANAFAKTGYTFLGWATTADATTPEYADGAQYSYLPSNEDETITLYAVWQEKEPELPGRQLVGLGRVYLTAGQEYYFGSDGTYSVDGDTSAYAPGITFYVPESGYYTISIQ